MKRHICTLLIVLTAIIAPTGCTTQGGVGGEDEIVILYDNDVHCAIEGYAKMSGLRDSLKSTHQYISIVSNGDYSSGGTIGSISKGEFPLEIMNSVGYDVVTLGNHEFDYSVPDLIERTKKLHAKTVCCNFSTIEGNKNLFEGYTMVNYGEVDVAYIGVTTPTTATSSRPTFFQDPNGHFIYSFGNAEEICSRVQYNADIARKEGAEYVIVLSHLGDEENDILTSRQLISRTEGIDAVLDGHDHHVIDEKKIPNKNGKEVILSSTGSRFANIGKLTINRQGIHTQLIATESIAASDQQVKDKVDKINEKVDQILGKEIGQCEILMRAFDDEGNSIARAKECNLGDLCADAIRIVTHSDIGFINGGGIRENMVPGAITYNTLTAIQPYSNTISTAMVSGTDILNALELSVVDFPQLSGGFLQVSGIEFEIDTTIHSTVVMDENGLFQYVGSKRKVKNVKVLNRHSGKYVPLRTSEHYKLATVNYILLDYGCGYTFPSKENVSREEFSDIDVMEQYITQNLKGHVGKEYAEPQNRIKVR